MVEPFTTHTYAQTGVASNDRFDSFIRILQEFANTIMAIICIKIYSRNCSERCCIGSCWRMSTVRFCWRVTEKYSTKRLQVKKKKSQVLYWGREKKRQSICKYLYIQKEMPWLWRYGLVSLHPFHHREQEHGNDVTPRKKATRKSVLWTGSWTHSESLAPQTRRCGGRLISVGLTGKMTTDGANEQKTLFTCSVHFRRWFPALHSLMTLKCLDLKGLLLRC